MKTFFAALLVVILVLVGIEVGAAKYVGGIAAQNFEHLVALANEGMEMQVKIISYEKGWFRSYAVTETTFAGDTAPVMVVNHEILHGPIVFISHTPLKPLRFTLAVVNCQLTFPKLSLPSDTPIPHWEMSFPYQGGAILSSQEKPFAFGNGLLQVKGSGWEGSGHVSRNWDAYHVEAESELLTFSSKIFAANIHDMKSRINYENKAGNQTMDWEYVIKKITGPDNKVELLDKIMLSGKIISSGEGVDAGFAGGIDKIAFGNTVLGPESYEVKFQNLDKEALKQIIVSGQDPNMSTDIKKALVMKLLSRHPSIVIDKLILNLPEGNLNLQASLSIGGNDTKQAVDLDNIMKSMRAKIHAIMSKVLFRQWVGMKVIIDLSKDPKFASKSDTDKKEAGNEAVDRLIDSLTKDGILIDRGLDYEFSLDFLNGQWMANGKVIEGLSEQLMTFEQTMPPANAVDTSTPASTPGTNPAIGVQPLMPVTAPSTN